MLESLASGFLWSRWRGKRSRHSRGMRNPQVYVSVKRPMGRSKPQVTTTSHIYLSIVRIHTFHVVEKRKTIVIPLTPLGCGLWHYFVSCMEHCGKKRHCILCTSSYFQWTISDSILKHCPLHSSVAHVLRAPFYRNYAIRRYIFNALQIFKHKRLISFISLFILIISMHHAKGQIAQEACICIKVSLTIWCLCVPLFCNNVYACETNTRAHSLQKRQSSRNLIMDDHEALQYSLYIFSLVQADTQANSGPHRRSKRRWHGKMS